jgi:hypothetical protein
MRLTMRKLAIYAALLLVAVFVSVAASLLALGVGAVNDTARWIGLAVLLVCTVVIAVVMEVRFR